MRDRASPLVQLLRRRDRDRFQTALFAPAAHREALFTLYAFNSEIARVREIVSEPSLGLFRLGWWREAIEAAYEAGAEPRHVVALPLSRLIRERSLSRAHFERLIAARESDLEAEAPPDLEALEAYAAASSGSLVGLALEILGASSAEALAAANDVGIAYALAGLLRGLAAFAGRGRPFIPLDIAARAGLSAQDLERRRGTPALAAAAAEIAAAASSRLAEARERRSLLPRAALPALLPALIAEQSLLRLKRAGYDPFAPRFRERDPWQSWRLLSAYLRARF